MYIYEFGERILFVIGLYMEVANVICLHNFIFFFFAILRVAFFNG